MNRSLPEIIASNVLERFRSGLDLDNDTRHFLVSCEGLPDDTAITSFLNDRDSDYSPVYELIFYPDEAMRFRIETLIPARGLDQAEIDGVLSIAGSGMNDIPVNTGSSVVILPCARFRSGVLRYIKKLNLDIDTDIFPVMDAENFIQERMMLRSGRFLCTGETAEFLAALALRAREREHPGRAELFRFALNSVCVAKGRVLDQLEKIKYFYESAIREAAEFRDILGKYSMEFIMAKKMAVPLTGFDEASEAIRKIDVITGLVYGITIPPMDQGFEMLLRNGRLAEIE